MDRSAKCLLLIVFLFFSNAYADLDLIAGRLPGDNLAWKNTGDGTGPAWMSMPGWNLPDVGRFSVPALADLDGDEDFDAIIGELAGRTRAYENIGTATAPAWLERPEWALGIDFGDNAAPGFGDLDGDGLVDVMVGNSSGIIRFFRNSGSATAPAWTEEPAWQIDNGHSFAFPRVCDLDHDGDLDLASGSRKSGITTYRNIGTTNAPAWELAPASWNPPKPVRDRTTLAFGDLDEDGDCDVLLGNLPGFIIAAENVGAPGGPPSWELRPEWDVGSVGGGCATPYLVDLDADGVAGRPQADAGEDQTVVDEEGDGETVTLDGTASSDDGTIVSYLWSENDNPLGAEARLDVVLDRGRHTILLTVMDNEGNEDTDTVVVNVKSSVTPVLDLIVGQLNGDTDVYHNTGDASSPVWTRLAAWDLPHFEHFSVPALADLDGDGDNDAIIGSEAGHTMAYENIGTPGAPVWVARSEWAAGIADPGANAAPGFGDLDGDGDWDLMVGETGGSISFYENTGSATAPQWTLKPSWALNTGHQYSFPRVCDLDLDGDLDLISGSRMHGFITYRNDGTANAPLWASAPEWSPPSSGERATLTFGDLDGDGDCDVVRGNFPAHVTAVENTGGASGPVWQERPDWGLDGKVADGCTTPYLVGLNTDVGIPGPPGTPEMLSADAGADQTIVDDDNSGLEPVTLDGTASSDDGTIVSYVWTENGGVLATEATLTIDLPVGNHEITLTVMDDDGNQDMDAVVITVEPPAAPAPLEFSVTSSPSPARGTAPLVVTFTRGSVSGGSGNYTYEWHFGDGGLHVGADQSRSHTYQLGSYSFLLTVTDNETGAVATKSVAVQATEPPVPVSGDAIVDIILPNVPNAVEEIRGGFLGFNGDDDDDIRLDVSGADFGKPDYTEDEATSNNRRDGDLVPVKLDVKQAGNLPVTGTVVFSASGAGGEVALWRDANKRGGRIPLDEPIPWPDGFTETAGTTKRNFYLEGIAASDSVRDIELTATFTSQGETQPGGSDLIRLTVTRVDVIVGTPDLTEEQEENPGELLVYNGDDDDGNGRIDARQFPVPGEDDLVEARVTVYPRDLTDEFANASVTLRLRQEGARGALWSDSEKTSRADLSLKVKPDIFDQPGQVARLYVERRKNSRPSKAKGDKGLLLQAQLGNINNMGADKVRDSARFASGN